MNKYILGLFLAISISAGGFIIWQNWPDPAVETKFVQDIIRPRLSNKQSQVEPTESSVFVKLPGDFVDLDNPTHIYQTFNNCGPATLTMMLNWLGGSANQSDLGREMRPYQNQAGDNDDKTIFTYEFVDWAKKYGFEAVGHVNGDIDLLKTFTVNGIPVVVKTWLHPQEDIGHFRIVTGFDEGKKEIIQDDSYDGPNRRISYYDFLSMWQPFNYDYMIVYTNDQEELVKAIIGSEVGGNTDWFNSLTRAQKEAELDPKNVYPVFNQSTAYYHLGDYQKSVEAFEQVQDKLPRRMLWYQIEPILAYRDLKNYDRVFEISQQILDNGNRAFSELYQIRGEIYLEQGNIDAARREFEQALQYNENYEAAQIALQNLN